MSAEHKHRIPFLVRPRVGQEAAKWIAALSVPIAVGGTLINLVQQDSNAVTPNYSGIARMSDRPQPPLMGTLRVPDGPVRPADQPLPQEPIIQVRVKEPILRAILNPGDLRTYINPDPDWPGRNVISVTRTTDSHITTVSASIVKRENPMDIDWTTAINIKAIYEKRSPLGNTLLAAVECSTNSLNSRNFQEVSGEFSGNQFSTEDQTLYRQASPLSPDQLRYQTYQANLAAETTNLILSKHIQPR